MEKSLFDEYSARIKDLDEKLAELDCVSSEEVPDQLVNECQIKDLIRNLLDLDLALTEQSQKYPAGTPLSLTNHHHH
jgi:hypothetical protein